MIKNIIFDFGGVIMTLNHPGAIERFAQLGLKDAAQRLDPYTQGGIFGDAEIGKIDAEEFRQKLSALCGKELTWEQCQWGWLGYNGGVPARNVAILKQLRAMGYRLVLLSNTNPFMMAWAQSKDFSRNLDSEQPDGMPVGEYFDACYVSYEVGAMKPDTKFFSHVMEHENLVPEETIFLDDGPKNIEAAQTLGLHTMQPANGEDWTDKLLALLDELNG